LDSIPPKEVAAKQFILESFKNLWAGRNQRQLQLLIISLAFFTAFKQSFWWLPKNVTRHPFQNFTGLLSLVFFLLVIQFLNSYPSLQKLCRGFFRLYLQQAYNQFSCQNCLPRLPSIIIMQKHGCCSQFVLLKSHCWWWICATLLTIMKILMYNLYGSVEGI
jgi:hypothetical protein